MTQKRAGPSPMGKKVSKTGGKNWLIAVDPFSGFDLSAVRSLSASLSEEAGARPIAAYVLAPASMNWTGTFSNPWINRYRPVAEEKMRELFPGGMETTVIPCRHSGLRASVDCLAKFAKKIKAEMIVISTHARHGLERITMGSFAETLILSTKVPVLVANPAHPVPAKIGKILVPTDLSKESLKYVVANGEFAKRIGAEVILLHKQPDPLDPLVQQGVYTLGGGWVSVQNFIDEDISAKQKQLAKIVEGLSKRGIKARSMVDASPRGLIESINQTAQEQGADLITVWTHSGPVSAAILGSVARGLVRTSPVPVLVRR